MTEYERIKTLVDYWHPERIVVNRSRMEQNQRDKAEAVLSRAGYKLTLAAGRLWVYERQDGWKSTTDGNDD